MKPSRIFGFLAMLSLLVAAGIFPGLTRGDKTGVQDPYECRKDSCAGNVSIYGNPKAVCEFDTTNSGEMCWYVAVAGTCTYNTGKHGGLTCAGNKVDANPAERCDIEIYGCKAP
jgi:hypothetical protein